MDFLGRYLLAYVQRKKKAQTVEDELRDIETQAKLNAQATEETKAAETAQLAEIASAADALIASDKERFIALNAESTAKLAEYITKIPELEEAALTYVPPPPVTEGGEGEGGEGEGGEAPPAEPVPVAEEPAAAPEGEGEVLPEEPQYDENGTLIVKPPPPVPEKTYKNGLIVQKVWNDLFLPGEPAFEAVMSLSSWTPAPLNGDNTAAFTTAFDRQVIALLLTLCTLLGAPTDGLYDPSGQPSWSLLRMKLLPLLPSRLANYDATEKRTVPPEQSISYIKQSIADQALDRADAYPAYVPVAPLLVQWIEKAIATRELCMKFHGEKAEPEVLETVEAVVVADEGAEEE